MCNRLLHHFAEPDVRIGVLRELARVSRGPVIVSFSNTFGRRFSGRSSRGGFEDAPAALLPRLDAADSE